MRRSPLHCSRRAAVCSAMSTLLSWLREAYFAVEHDGEIVFCIGNREVAEAELLD